LFADRRPCAKTVVTEIETSSITMMGTHIILLDRAFMTSHLLSFPVGSEPVNIRHFIQNHREIGKEVTVHF
jgi:hypothetical protein